MIPTSSLAHFPIALRRRILSARLLSSPLIICIALLLSGCKPANSGRLQGYVEGEFVYVASPIAGQLNTLSVARGDQVKAGTPLFSLDNRLEIAARDQATRRLAQAQANLEDARKGKRPSEIQSLQAQLDQAQASLVYAQNEMSRAEGLVKTGAMSQDQYDLDRSNRDQALQRVTQLQADLQTAQLGQRTDQIAAAEEEVKAQQAALAQAEWNLSQKHQDAPRDGLVFDTLYYQGEWVDAGHPIVQLLPPQNVKVRAYIGEPGMGALHVGDGVQVIVDGAPTPVTGKISFISPQAEYTPPVIYSQENRDKLMYLIEIRFDPATSATLHPGQPVDVVLNDGAP
jgi:HlyD family secretion protein